MKEAPDGDSYAGAWQDDTQAPARGVEILNSVDELLMGVCSQIFEGGNPTVVLSNSEGRLYHWWGPQINGFHVARGSMRMVDTCIPVLSSIPILPNMATFS